MPIYGGMTYGGCGHGGMTYGGCHVVKVMLEVGVGHVWVIVETSPISIAIFAYVSRGWQPCLAPRDVILQAPLRHPNGVVTL